MHNADLHVAPDVADIERNKELEPEGERLRSELVAWLDKNGIVSIYLDTPEHTVEVRIVKLPPRINSVLRLWGSIYVRNPQTSDISEQTDRQPPQAGVEEKP